METLYKSAEEILRLPEAPLGCNKYALVPCFTRSTLLLKASAEQNNTDTCQKAWGKSDEIGYLVLGYMNSFKPKTERRWVQELQRSPELGQATLLVWSMISAPPGGVWRTYSHEQGGISQFRESSLSGSCQLALTILPGLRLNRCCKLMTVMSSFKPAEELISWSLKTGQSFCRGVCGRR